MKISYKFIAVLIVVLSVVIYIFYSQYKINKLSKDNNELAVSLESALAYNEVYDDIIRSYEAALNDKEKVIEEAEHSLQQISEQLKGLQDEHSKTFLSTSTPASVEQLLKSTDYYYKTSNSGTSSKLSGAE